MLIHDLPLIAHLDPRCAVAGEDGAGVAVFVGIIDNGISIGHDNGIVGVDANRALPGGDVARRIGLEKGDEEILDRRLALNPVGLQ